jgi:hypothetical protein
LPQIGAKCFGVGDICAETTVKGGELAVTKHQVKKALEVLNELRAELHGKADDSVIEDINEAIAYLESALQGDFERFFDAVKFLNLFGSLIAKLPEIAEALAELMAQ